jgi:hypothetical protein
MSFLFLISSHLNLNLINKLQQDSLDSSHKNHHTIHNHIFTRINTRITVTNAQNHNKNHHNNHMFFTKSTQKSSQVHKITKSSLTTSTLDHRAGLRPRATRLPARRSSNSSRSCKDN